jgi:glutaredoxin
MAYNAPLTGSHPKDTPMHKITLYTKPGCKLCDAARHVIDTVVSQRSNALIEIVDISADPALNEKYHLDIPVIFVDGQELSRHKLDPDQLAKCIMDEPGENLLGFS